MRARPPSEKWVSAPTEEIVNQSFQILGEKYPHIELLIGCEGNSFHSTSNIRTDLLSITSVHPMRREALCKMVEKSDSDWSTVNSLVEQGDLCEVEYRGSSYYVRSFHQ
jgi:wyosine [tRNA(Phe)-imidazoG37] synthetase (radical SAM superfamily)